MKIGTEILWRGRPYVLVGVDPMNVPDRRAYLRELDGSAEVEAPFEEISERPDAPGFVPKP